MSRRWWQLCCLFVGLALPQLAYAQSYATIVTQKKVAAYKTVTAEIQEGLGAQTRVYDMEDSDKHNDEIKAQISQQKPSVIIAVGFRAAVVIPL